MSGQEKSKQEFEEMIKSTIDSINEALVKSGYMAKADGDESQPDELSGQSDAPPADAAPEASAPPAAEGEQSPDAPPADAAPEAPAAEGEQDSEGGDEMAEMAQHLSEMPDEELHMLLELIQGEMMKRQEGQGEGAPEGDGGMQKFDTSGITNAAAAGGVSPAQMASASRAGFGKSDDSKEQMDAMAKSVGDMAEAVKALAKQNESLKTEIASLKKSQSKPAAKPAASNRTVQVLAKSSEAPKAESLSKSDVENFLMNEMRKSASQRHPAISSGTIAELTYVKTPEQIQSFVADLRKKGVTFPA